MPALRKRALQELDSGNAHSPKPPSMLQRIRNMWQFANLYQFIMLFGKALKLDDNIDISDLEAECLKPGSLALQDIGLGILKFLSSHRGLTYAISDPSVVALPLCLPHLEHRHELFDEYTRRQFLSKAPSKNPFGTDETPARFADFDVFTKIRVLQQMTQLVMMSPERVRERAEEQKDADQTNWRIEPYGWDRDDRTYFVLDDNRVYRMTEAPPVPAKPKKNTKKARAAQRASKRRRVSSGVASEAEDDAGDEASENGLTAEPEDNGLGGMKWECLAVTLEEVRGLVSNWQKTKDPNEKILRDQLQEHLIPILEQQEESRKRKQLQREKELMNLEKMAHAKRSSRIAGRMEHRKIEEQAREEKRKRLEEEAARRKEEKQLAKMESERNTRLMSREQRLKEREVRRVKHEEELAQLSEDSKATSTHNGRMSERRRLAEIEKNKKALEELEEEQEDWIFDCICGAFGQIDDGTHSVACERCNVWQHSKCLGISESEAEKDDFHFVCSRCRQRAEHPQKIKIKIKQSEGRAAEDNATASSPNAGSAQPNNLADQSTENPREQEKIAIAPSTKLTNGQVNNPFSSPHPNLPPPTQSFSSFTSRNSDYDGGRGTSAEEMAESNGVSVLAGSSPSPTKQPQPPSSPPTKTISAVPSTLGGEMDPSHPALQLGATPSASTMLPFYTPTRSQNDGDDDGDDDDDDDDERASHLPLPPSSSGLSPTKQPSPPASQRQFNRNLNGLATGGSSPAAVVFPPLAALSPSPRQQILTPPVKHTEPVRSSPLQSSPPTSKAMVAPPSVQPRTNA
ncbi:reticulocyte-binding protein 2 a [Podospora fimiseda]|uniref:Reticulocyte-binding protein 2 a n=1 Tax=Podospora fimiseda TaxID=252190 RepID=A0AAN7BJW2_9PEZI|nr:reticulocyte-binding protein 2 a [Podospora fimiseda]